MNDEQALAVAEQAARAGGKVAMARLKDPGYLRWKGHRDVVTGSTMDVQEAILAVLREETPDFAILAEEGPEDEPIPVDAPDLWIVDPICGSLNFAQGLPYFGISIALRSGGDIRVGVVYDPSRDEMFTATVETPTRLNGELVFVQQISEGYEAFEKAWVGTDLPHTGKPREEAEQVVLVMATQVTDLSIMGSPALGICNVAVGRLHAYWHLDLRIWDVAAAYLVLRRAGGTFTDGYGDSWLHSEGGYIASNSIIHGWTLRAMQQVYALRKAEPFGLSAISLDQPT